MIQRYRWPQRAAVLVLASAALAGCNSAYSSPPALFTGTAAPPRTVASVAVVAPTLTHGTAFSGPLNVNAKDSAGAPITGSAPYAASFTLTDNDASAHTSLTVGSTTGKTVTVSSPNDVVIVNYDGATIGSFTITASVPGGGTVTVN